MDKLKIGIGGLFLVGGIWMTVGEGGHGADRQQAHEHKLLGELAAGKVTIMSVENQLDNKNRNDFLWTTAGGMLVGYGIADILDGSRRRTGSTAAAVSETPSQE